MILLLWCWLWSAAAVVGPASGRIRCDEAHKRCMFREDCTKTLFNYMKDCSDVLSGISTRCPWSCRRTLISLMSHESGVEMATCDCGDDAFCKTSKERLEVCRPEVSYATADNTVVSCSIAELICSADTQCSTALAYYHRLCKSMFHGHKCTRRCNNSLNILGRQDKAAKLHDCYCDGSEDFPCIRIKQNTQRLCLGKETYVEETHHLIPTTPDSNSGCRTLKSSWCLTCLLSCILILCSLRTCSEDFSLFTKDSLTAKVNNKLSSMIHQWLVSLHFIVWPWWWTSEKHQKLGQNFSTEDDMKLLSLTE